MLRYASGELNFARFTAFSLRLRKATFNHSWRRFRVTALGNRRRRRRHSVTVKRS